MSTSTQHLDLGDPRALADLETFLGRARRANPDGAVRLQVVGGFVLVTVAVLEGSGLLGEGTVLGLRVAPVRPDGTDDAVDATVSFASLADRLARREASAGSSVLAVPPTTVRASWSGLTPPRDGWEPVGRLSSETVDAVAREGISQVAQGTPDGAGGHAVTALRRRVWGAMTDTVPPVAAGLAFGAHVLGFTAPGAEASVSTNGRWTRLSTARGHVLVR
ncbi:hypothetical protein [Intrasporangium flavum]|uniref:hypothetical protein n=1 Tax=Intrasporangium flavum TaxID=1428657 RepID=UPI00096D36C5|nr:hypothetical protein [Intrasporangium flavum]